MSTANSALNRDTSVIHCAAVEPNRRKIPTSFTLPPGVFRMLQELVDTLSYSDRSTLVEVLIREEWERRHGRINMQAPAASPPVSSGPAPDPVAAQAASILDTERQRVRRTGASPSTGTGASK